MSLGCWIYQQVHRLTCYCDCIYRSFSTEKALEDWGFEFIFLGFSIWLKVYDSSCISTTTSSEPLFYQSFLVSSTVCLRMDPVLNVKQIEATKTIKYMYFNTLACTWQIWITWHAETIALSFDQCSHSYVLSWSYLYVVSWFTVFQDNVNLNPFDVECLLVLWLYKTLHCGKQACASCYHKTTVKQWRNKIWA